MKSKPPVFHCQVFNGKNTVAFYTRKTYAEAKDGREKTQLQVELIDHMGDDLTVVNVFAKKSFGKKKTQFDHGDLRERLSSCKTQDHWSPFGHASMQFHIKAPIFVARQLVKHQVGLVWNEISRRYVDDEPEFYTPKSWRLKAEDKKQGSSEETSRI